jgi:hypothetical protein
MLRLALAVAETFVASVSELFVSRAESRISFAAAVAEIAGTAMIISPKTFVMTDAKMLRSPMPFPVLFAAARTETLGAVMVAAKFCMSAGAEMRERVGLDFTIGRAAKFFVSAGAKMRRGAVMSPKLVIMSRSEVF